MIASCAARAQRLRVRVFDAWRQWSLLSCRRRLLEVVAVKVCALYHTDCYVNNSAALSAKSAHGCNELLVATNMWVETIY